MGKLFLMLFIALLMSCNPGKSKRELSLFNDISFNLLQGENIVKIKPGTKKLYLGYLKNQKVQVPLYSCIENKDYRIFIGIPYMTTIEELKNLNLTRNGSAGVLYAAQSADYIFKIQKDKTMYLTEYAVNFDKNLIYVLAVTRSKNIADSLFNHLGLSGRFKQK